METKKLDRESLDIILEFEEKCFGTDRWKVEDWIDLLTDERATYYGIMEENKLIGNVFTYNWQGEKDYIKIMNLSVHPQYRNKGLAHKLMEMVHNEMAESKLQRICAETRASNAPMQKVFVNCGYELEKVEENCYESPTEDGYKYVFRKTGKRRANR